MYFLAVGDSKWYTQKASGEIPPNRRKFCAGSTWAKDQSSYNIYIYGGFGFGENVTGFDDVWILTLPTFEWIKWYPEAPGASAPHGLLTCNVIENSQMMVMGGNFTNSTACDVPTLGGQHNLNLGQVNVENSKWYQYLPNLTSYSVPPAIVSVAGGTSSGGAINLAPADGWSDAALSVYFGQKAQFAERTPTRYIPSALATTTPTPTPAPNHKSNVGTIVGAVVGAVAALTIIGVAVFFYLRRRKSSTGDRLNSVTGQTRDGSTVHEVSASPTSDVKLTMINTGLGSPISSHSHTPSPYSAALPGQAVPYGPYQQSPYHPHPAQPFYPVPIQQSGYGYQPFPMNVSLPGGGYTQQQYFPPQELPQSSPPSSPPVSHEMPAPGLHLVNSGKPQRVDSAEFPSDHKHSQSQSVSQSQVTDRSSQKLS